MSADVILFPLLTSKPDEAEALARRIGGRRATWLVHGGQARLGRQPNEARRYDAKVPACAHLTRECYAQTGETRHLRCKDCGALWGERVHYINNGRGEKK